MGGYGQPAQPSPGSTAFVRSYVIAGGRTRPKHNLRADTILEAGSVRPEGRLMEGEYGKIIALCRERRRSLTELAGTVEVTLTVARVLVSDLIEAHALAIPIIGTGYEASDPDDPRGDRAHTQLLERLRVGLVNLPT
ncbi:DUF742 domain-containing protein [Streptomyces griseorubiginosus]|uniref:DUF742 domain-containing protein n=1 Tax=Streptomyces griseorubiginosus TaxID=67304 RepID=UPI0036E532E3